MTARAFYRSSAVLYLLFAAGHTLGFLRFRPDTPEGAAVLDSMRNVHFQFGSATASYGQLYTGFGLFVSACLLFFAWLSWQLGAWTGSSPAIARSAARALFIVALANAVICLVYFGPVQTVFAVAGVLLLAAALLLSRKPAPALRGGVPDPAG